MSRIRQPREEDNGSNIRCDNVMVLIGVLFGWLLPKMSALSVFSSRLAGLVVMAFVAPAIYSVNSGVPYVAALIPYGIAALIAAVIFYFLKSRQQAA